MKSNFEFQNKTFCFTGKMIELKRTQAEKEVRMRGGNSIDSITPQLDYLVIGSIPSPSWKNGDYGTKIEKAQKLFSENSRKPLLISEESFMEHLYEFPIVSTGDITSKLLHFKYSFIAEDNEIDYEELFDLLELLQKQENTFVNFIEETFHYTKLFEQESYLEEKTNIVCKILKQLDVNDNVEDICDKLSMLFEGIQNLDGKVKYSVKTSGTSEYVRLLKEIPKWKRRET